MLQLGATVRLEPEEKGIWFPLREAIARTLGIEVEKRNHCQAGLRVGEERMAVMSKQTIPQGRQKKSKRGWSKRASATMTVLSTAAPAESLMTALAKEDLTQDTPKKKKITIVNKLVNWKKRKHVRHCRH